MAIRLSTETEVDLALDTLMHTRGKTMIATLYQDLAGLDRERPIIGEDVPHARRRQLLRFIEDTMTDADAVQAIKRWIANDEAGIRREEAVGDGRTIDPFRLDRVLDYLMYNIGFITGEIVRDDLHNNYEVDGEVTDEQIVAAMKRWVTGQETHAEKSGPGDARSTDQTKGFFE